MRRVFTFVILALACAVTVQAQDAVVSYDAFGRMSDQEKLLTFDKITPQNRALIVRTQAERWLTANRERLTDEQVRAVEAGIEIIRPELYDDVDREADLAAVQDVMDRVTELLSKRDVMQAFTRRGAYIPRPEGG